MIGVNYDGIENLKEVILLCIFKIDGNEIVKVICLLGEIKGRC